MKTSDTQEPDGPTRGSAKAGSPRSRPVKSRSAVKSSGRESGSTRKATARPGTTSPGGRASGKRTTAGEAAGRRDVNAEVGPRGARDPRDDDDLWGDDDLWSEDWSDMGSAGDADGRGRSGSDPTRQWATEQAELFQRATLELIAAARTALDTVEELVADPQALGTALEALRDIASDVVRAARPGPHSHTTARQGDPSASEEFQAIRLDDD